jgi:dolichol-phosphate mannosyltransferase
MPPDISIIVPTLNESENLPLLVPRVHAAMAGRSYEMIIVDDNSRDATPQVCATLAQTYPVQLLVRQQPKNGLSGAVLHGMTQAQGKYFVVMDADLQHPPERIGALLEPLEQGHADFTLGSRYVSGGSTEASWGLFRQVNSLVATSLARPFAGQVTDPMSGFFALPADSYRSARQLTPLGYKIALELMCKCRSQNVREIPIHFGLRAKGESKLSIKQQFRYLEHLSRLYDFTFPRASPAIKFLIALGLSWVAALGVFVPLWTGGLGATASAGAAYGVAILVTALFHARYVRTQREFLIRPAPWRDFAIIAALEWLSCIAIAAWVARRLRDPSASAVEAFVVPFAAATAVRYVLRKELMQDIRGLRREIRAEQAGSAA